MIEPFVPYIIAASVTLNALWLLGSWLTTRRSPRRWFYRVPALVVSSLAVAWTVRMVTLDPRPSHTLRALDVSIDLDLAGLAWHLWVPVALLVMLARGIVVVVGSRGTRQNAPRQEKSAQLGPKRA